MNMTEKRKSYDLKLNKVLLNMLKKIVTEKLVESSLSMKTWFVDGERNRLKSAINLPLKAKREDCLVEDGNHFLETKFFFNNFIPDFNSPFRKINAASILGRLLFKKIRYSIFRRYYIFFFSFFCLYSCFFCLFVCFLKLKIYILIHIRLCGSEW